jgi:hypothetical protein
MIDDGTLGGYLGRHDRPPAFEGRDGNPYTVAIYTDNHPNADGRYGAAVLFVRWSASGDAPSGHLETEYLVQGDTPGEAEEFVRQLSLYDVKAHLDRLIAAHVESTDW